MKHIYVSPHSDDVALSCGGQVIAHKAAGRDIMVLNIFTSDRNDLRRQRGGSQSSFVDAINADRTAEDKAAWDSLGIEAHYANLPESLLRGRFPFRIFGRAEDPIVDEIRDVILSFAEAHPDAVFYFPAGIGNHVDHLACREAAFRLLEAERLSRIHLYEDVPYSWLRFIRKRHYRSLLKYVDVDEASAAVACRSAGESLPGYLTRGLVPFPRGRKLFSAIHLASFVDRATRARMDALPDGRGHLHRITLSDDETAQKKALLYRYESQIPMLFGDRPEEMLTRHRNLLSTEIVMELSLKSRART